MIYLFCKLNKHLKKKKKIRIQVHTANSLKQCTDILSGYKYKIKLLIKKVVAADSFSSIILKYKELLN